MSRALVLLNRRALQVILRLSPIIKHLIDRIIHLSYSRWILTHYGQTFCQTPRFILFRWLYDVSSRSWRHLVKLYLRNWLFFLGLNAIIEPLSLYAELKHLAKLSFTLWLFIYCNYTSLALRGTWLFIPTSYICIDLMIPWLLPRIALSDF